MFLTCNVPNSAAPGCKVCRADSCVSLERINFDFLSFPLDLDEDMIALAQYWQPQYNTSIVATVRVWDRNRAYPREAQLHMHHRMRVRWDHARHLFLLTP